MVSVFDVAKYILEKLGRVSTWKLQKLCYYAQAWTLAWSDNHPLFNEDFEAWTNGPVCRLLFNAHKGSYTISADELHEGDSRKLNAEERENVDIVLQSYGDKEPWWLREKTHSEDPWKLAREKAGVSEDAPCSEVITKESMGRYYGSL